MYIVNPLKKIQTEVEHLAKLEHAMFASVHVQYLDL